MKSNLLRELTLYRYRYILSYGLFVAFLFALLLTNIGTIPDGISTSEMKAAVSSNSLNPLAPRAQDVINLPYHLMQKASIGIFGLSPLSIRLPSLILAFVASIALALTLHQWFRRGIAILALLLATASEPFISMARTGTADVFYMLLLLTILLGAVKLTTRGKRTFIWKLVVATAGLLLFYMPLGVYAVIALLIAGIIHPHVRYQLKRTKWWQYLILTLLAAALLSPLILAGLTDNNTLATLFGISSLSDKLSPAGLWASMILIIKTLFWFHRPETTEILVPFLNLTSVLLVTFGLVRTIHDRSAARSYLLIIWLAISIPLLILNPGQFALLFVPCIILLAIGLDTLLREWYRLFPHNPYARLSAFIPLSLIVVGLIVIASSRYFYGYFYTDTTEYYHPELTAIRKELKPHVGTKLIVPNSQVAFYDILRSKYPLLAVSSDTAAANTASELIVLGDTTQRAGQVPSRIITSYHARDSVLLRVYTPSR